MSYGYSYIVVVLSIAFFPSPWDFFMIIPTVFLNTDNRKEEEEPVCRTLIATLRSRDTGPTEEGGNTGKIYFLFSQSNANTAETKEEEEEEALMGSWFIRLSKIKRDGGGSS